MTKLDLQAYKCALFDLDGTLLETRPELVSAMAGTFAARGWPFDRKLASQFVGHGGVATLTALRPGIDPEDIPEVIDDFVRRYQVSLGSHTQWMNGAERLVDWFVSRGLPVGIVTNKKEVLTHALLRKLSLHDLFDPIICADTFDTCKPEPVGIFAALEQWELSPLDAIWFGDSYTDSETGRAAGVFTVLQRVGYTPLSEIDGQGDLQVADWSELELP